MSWEDVESNCTPDNKTHVTGQRMSYVTHFFSRHSAVYHKIDNRYLPMSGEGKREIRKVFVTRNFPQITTTPLLQATKLGIILYFGITSNRGEH